MADVVIRGIEMPKGEMSYVEFQIWGDGTVYKRRGLAGKLEQVGTAIPLPEGHGRLGDLDALKTGLFVFDEITRDYYINRKEIENAPTIVPAEGGVEE